MLTYISIIALTGSLNAAAIDKTEIHSVQSEMFQPHIAQADTTASDEQDDGNEKDEYIEWTFL